MPETPGGEESRGVGAKRKMFGEVVSWRKGRAAPSIPVNGTASRTRSRVFVPHGFDPSALNET